jgi:hypothetical protein
MKCLITSFLLMLGILTISGNASAMTITQYKDTRNNKEQWPVTQVYLNGVGVGATLAASVLIQQNRPPLFCQPNQIVLKADDYIKLIDAFIAKNEVADAKVESILLMALVTAFPCT